METSGLGPRSLAAWVKAGTWPLVMRQAYGSCWKHFLTFVLAQFAFGIWSINSVSLYLAVLVPGV